MHRLGTQLVRRWRSALAGVPAKPTPPAIVWPLGPMGNWYRPTELSERPTQVADRFQRCPPTDLFSFPAIIGSPRIGRRGDDSVGIVMGIVGESRIVSPHALFGIGHARCQSACAVRQQFLEHFLGSDGASTAVLRLTEKLDRMNPREPLIGIPVLERPEAIEQLHRVA